jgi:hypothetical protein
MQQQTSEHSSPELSTARAALAHAFSPKPMLARDATSSGLGVAAAAAAPPVDAAPPAAAPVFVAAWKRGLGSRLVGLVG